MRKTFDVWILLILLTIFTAQIQAQRHKELDWSRDGNSYFQLGQEGFVQVNLPSMKTTILVPKERMIPTGQTSPLPARDYLYYEENQELLLFTNTKKVWRYHTRGDYWVYNSKTGSLSQLGKSLPSSSLMFAKISPDGKLAAYVSEHNLFVEEIAAGKIKQLTFNGSRKMINGTFDWVYEEEFDCRDGFRWSPDSKQIAYWQIDDRNTPDYLMLNTTDSTYSRSIPVEYPVAGQMPSPFKIGVLDISTAKTTWMDVVYDSKLGSYVPRMEWADNGRELIIQHLNRRQNESQIILCNAASGKSKVIFSEKDPAWIDVISQWDESYKYGGWDWLDHGNEFIWASDKDGWRHLFRMNMDGKNEILITPGDYDVMEILNIDEKDNAVYFLASPENATQAYLYKSRLDGKGRPELLSPINQIGTHSYEISPNSKYALHSFSNYFTPPADEWISLPDHNIIDGKHNVYHAVTSASKASSNMEFFKITTADGVETDGWMVKPIHFDSTKKYPVLFLVYTEPADATVKDKFGTGVNPLYMGNMAEDGYIYVSIDNRGTPSPKGVAWRKANYRKIGRINIRDQAMGAKEILKWPWVDSSRIAVWGWSGGGSATLNLLFQYPEIYKTGLAFAAEGNMFTYDNIYQERYMGLPQENKEDYVNGSPITYARNLQGNLLYVHGTGDDNVHYNNAEMLINELVKYNKKFQLMIYPNRTHAISEGPGTRLHLATLFTNYLKEHCPPGPK